MNRFRRQGGFANKKKKRSPDDTPRAGTVSAIMPQAHDQERVNVFLDGEFAFGLSLLTATRFGLFAGKQLSATDVARLRGEESIENAFESALNFLSYRARSEDEVRRNLEKKGIVPETIEAVMERLKRTGLVNDDDFAGYWTKQRRTHSPRSARAIRHELRLKGVDSETIDRALEQQTTETTGDAEADERELAYRAAQKRARQLVQQGVDLMAFKRKLGGLLARRGFSYATISPVLRRLWQELHDASGTDGDEEADLDPELEE